MIKYILCLTVLMNSLLGLAQDAISWYNSGIDKFEEGNVLGAIKDFNAAIELNPKMAEAYWGRGSVYAEMEEFEPALKDLNTCIKIDPGVGDAFYNRAFVFMALDKPQKALNDLNMYVLLNPDDINGYLSRLDILVKFGMRSEAYADMEKASRLKASNPSEFLQRSIIRYLMKDTLGCIKDLDNCISQSPSFLEAYYLRGKYHY